MIGIVMSFLAASAVLSPDDEPPRPAPQDSFASPTKLPTVQQDSSDGIWPSERLTRSLLLRWANRMGDRFELEPDERERVRKATVDRWGRFLKDNRADLQPLLNEFLEMRLGEEVPSDEQVRRWADRAMPALAQLEAQAREATGEIREIMPPEKSVQFEAEALKMGLGLQAAAEKLKQWQAGKYDPHEVWQAPRHERRSRKSKDRQEPSGTTADRADPAGDLTDAPASVPEEDQITQELARWDKFVQDFIQDHDYDKSQKSASLSALSELKGRAIAHRDRYKTELARLEMRIENNTGSDEEVASIKADLISLYGPIDDMFEELKTRVEGVATTQQRIRASEEKQRKEAREKAAKTD